MTAHARPSLRRSLSASAPIALLALACAGAPAGGGPEQVPVTAATVVKEDVPIDVRAIGTVQPYSTVEVRAQVGGVLEKVHFREGRDVRRGELLFSLDARPYQAALEAAQASLARDQVQLETARQDVARYTDLVKKEYVTQEEYDRIRTNKDALEAAVRADQAAVDKAQVDLGYCTIRSPIDGRTGQLMVHAGNLVKANADSPMVVINQLTPVYVAFSVPEEHLGEIRAREKDGPLEVRARPRDHGRDSFAGTLSFIDNAVDRTTGTVRLKATFPNRDRALWPGEFVDASLRVSVRHGAILVPSQAIQTGQQGSFVFVIGPDQAVATRPVTAGEAVDGRTIIEKGLEAGETVVTDGQLRLVDGAKVTVKQGLGEDAGS